MRVVIIPKGVPFRVIDWILNLQCFRKGAVILPDIIINGRFIENTILDFRNKANIIVEAFVARGAQRVWRESNVTVLTSRGHGACGFATSRRRGIIVAPYMVLVL